MSDFKLGPIDGAAALIVLVVAILAAVCLVAVLIVSIIKAIKERNDQKEDQAENEFLPNTALPARNCASIKRLLKSAKNSSSLCARKCARLKTSPSSKK